MHGISRSSRRRNRGTAGIDVKMRLIIRLVLFLNEPDDLAVMNVSVLTGPCGDDKGRKSTNERVDHLLLVKDGRMMDLCSLTVKEFPQRVKGFSILAFGM